MKCPNCKREYTPDLEKTATNSEKRWWEGGKLIQNVWPNATPIQREQLQTGICSDACWDQFLGVVDKGRGP